MVTNELKLAKTCGRECRTYGAEDWPVCWPRPYGRG